MKTITRQLPVYYTVHTREDFQANEFRLSEYVYGDKRSQGWRHEWQLASYALRDGKLVRSARGSKTFREDYSDGSREHQFRTLKDAATYLLPRLQKYIKETDREIARAQRRFTAIGTYRNIWAHLPAITIDAPKPETELKGVESRGFQPALGQTCYVVQNRVHCVPEFSGLNGMSGERIVIGTVSKVFKNGKVNVVPTAMVESIGGKVDCVSPGPAQIQAACSIAAFYTLEAAALWIVEDCDRVRPSWSGAKHQESKANLEAWIATLSALPQDKPKIKGIELPADGQKMIVLDQSHYERIPLRGTVVSNDGLSVMLGNLERLKPTPAGLVPVPLRDRTRQEDVWIYHTSPSMVLKDARHVVSVMRECCTRSLEELAKGHLREDEVGIYRQLLPLWKNAKAKILRKQTYRKRFPQNIDLRAFGTNFDAVLAGLDDLREELSTLKFFGQIREERGHLVAVTHDPIIARRYKMRKVA